MWIVLCDHRNDVGATFHGAVGRRKEACKHLEHRGLTRTVRADEGHRGSALKYDVDFLKRRAVAPNDRNLLQGQC